MTPYRHNLCHSAQEGKSFRLCCLIPSPPVCGPLFQGGSRGGILSRLGTQAAANPKEQFGNSPDLQDELMKSIIDAMAAQESMSKQALNSETVRARLLTVLLGPGELWEDLRGDAAAAAPIAPERGQPLNRRERTP